MVIVTPTFFEDGGWCNMSRCICNWSHVFSTSKSCDQHIKMIN